MVKILKLTKTTNSGYSFVSSSHTIIWEHEHRRHDRDTTRPDRLRQYGNLCKQNFQINIFHFILQRIQLFNAFAASSFCNAGYPVLDVYPMTSSTSYQPEDGIHYDSWITKPIEKVLINYFKDD